MFSSRIRISVLFIIMTAAVLFAAVIGVPRVQINTDMVRYMPNEYAMKQGLDLLQEQLPALKEQLQEFSSIFADGNDLMPTGLMRNIGLGVVMIFVVLLVMCSSVMEVLLFLVTTGFAVVLNMGSNALLPSVSMMTNSLSSVLQMVLSMDYSIILMNRFREEKKRGNSAGDAIFSAMRGASSSILSSALTTIVSLLMLCFIRLKIGADLGIVLSKGVLLSLICNFTVLPALILWCDRAVEATRKKNLIFPSAPLARFEVRWRYPLTLLFLLLFVSFFFLKNRTQLSFAPTWKSAATDVQYEGNALLLLYSNADDASIPPLLENIAADTVVHMTVSYPSLMDVPRTARALKELAGQAAIPMTDEMLNLVYYAQAHPQRTERFSFRELQEGIASLSAQGLIPAGMKIPAFRPSVPTVPPSIPSRDSIRKEAPDTTINVQADTLCTPAQTTVDATAPLDTLPTARFSYEQISTPLTAAEMAEMMGMETGQVNMVYRLAGKRNGRMTAEELVVFVRDKILGDKRYAPFIPKGLAQNVAEAERELALIHAPDTLSSPAALTREPAPDAVADPRLAAQPEPETTPEATPGPEPTPLDELMEMVLSGRRYGSAQIGRALRKAGIPVRTEQLDLMFLYLGAKHHPDSTLALSPEHLLSYVADTLLCDPTLSAFVPDSLKEEIPKAREALLSQVGRLRGDDYSVAVILSGLERESEATNVCIEKWEAQADSVLHGSHYWIGESRMYKELRDGFPREFLTLTLLTILAIFLIVALTFRSLLIPVPLVMIVMSGIYVNIWASGLGGHTLYYLSCLMIQGILMGATIDSSILFTHYYLENRKTLDIDGAVAQAYKGSSHSILTSGLILSIVPFTIGHHMDDPMIGSVLVSLSVGAFAILLLILFLLPGIITAMDPLIRKRR